MEQENNFEEFEQETIAPKKRRKLFPWWIKVFIWIFMIFGLIAPIGLILGLLGMSFELSLYGIETSQPISVIGLLLIGLFALKGTTAFGMWTGKDWAIKIAKIDAILGIIICTVIMCVLPFLSESSSIGFTFRLELLLLIPYLIKLNKIDRVW